jgi:amino acid transporter
VYSYAEIISRCPTAGGQYHWVSEFAPPRIQKFLSYMVGKWPFFILHHRLMGPSGWLCGIAWQVYLGGACFMVGTIIQGLIALNVEGYVWENYHGTLLTIAVVCFAIIFNTALASRLPMLEGMALVLHLAGFFAVIIPLWVMGTHSSPRVLLEFSNNGGWSSVGLSAMIGLTSPMSVLTGNDCSVHMCKSSPPLQRFNIQLTVLTAEEIQDASITLPKAIMWSVVPNTTLGFLMAITLIFSLGNIENILATATGQPFIQVFFNATGSYAATNAMTAIVVVLLVCCAISELATCSRQIWSFARDRGLPFSGWLSRVVIPQQVLTLTDLTGYSWLEYPTSSCMRITRYLHSPSMHQPRLLHSSERHQLSRRRLNSQLIFHHHKLSHLEKNLWTSFAATKMVVGKVWLNNQYCSCSFFGSGMVLCVLAVSHASQCREYELVFDDVWGDHCGCAGVLCCEGKTSVCWACCAG